MPIIRRFDNTKSVLLQIAKCINANPVIRVVRFLVLGTFMFDILLGTKSLNMCTPSQLKWLEVVNSFFFNVMASGGLYSRISMHMQPFTAYTNM